MSQAFIYLPKKLYRMNPPGGGQFYTKLQKALVDAGIPADFRQRFSIYGGEDYADKGVHFVHQGLVRAPGVFNTGFAYIAPFWSVDPKGIFGESSIAELTFDAECENTEQAQAFFARLSKRNITRRLTKYRQPEGRPVLPADAIAVFLQGPSEPVERAQYCTEAQMVSRIAVAAGNRPILVKPHPRTADPETLAHVEKLAKAHPNVQIVDAHIHDMLASAALTCSISSSVSLEGMMHRKPALLFGKTDFHHIARTIHETDDVAAALDWALEVGSNLPYAAFLHWFLQKNCINMGRDDWFDRILARVGLDVNQG